MQTAPLAVAFALALGCNSEPTPAGQPEAPAAKLEPAPTPESAPAPAAEAPAEIAGPGFPKVAAFKNSPAGVRLSQDKDGTVKATATKPETKGQSYTVDLILSTGEERSISVTAN